MDSKKYRRLQSAIWLTIIPLALGSTLAFVNDLVPDIEMRLRLGVAFATALAALLAASVVIFLLHRRIRAAERTGGVIGVGAHTHRDTDFEAVWERAEKTVTCAGVGMTNVSQDDHRLFTTLRRGVDVVFLLPDPAWIDEEPERSRWLGAFYNGAGRSTEIRRSLHQLEKLKFEYESSRERHGTVKIQLYRESVPWSFTVADENEPSAFGVAEFHLFGNARARVRLILDSSSRHPVIRDVVGARNRLAATTLPDA